MNAAIFDHEMVIICRKNKVKQNRAEKFISDLWAHARCIAITQINMTHIQIYGSYNEIHT